jgi:hypothetical protein
LFSSPEINFPRRVECREKENILILYYEEFPSAILILHFGPAPANLNLSLPSGNWFKRMDSSESRWNGPGSWIADACKAEGEFLIALNPHSFLLLLPNQEK